MTLPRNETVPGILDELQSFEDLIASLDDTQWRQTSRCQGWTVGDVAAHVVGTQTDIIAGRMDGQGTDEVTARQVSERHDRSPAELAEELGQGRKAAADMLAIFDDAAWEGPAPGGFPGTLGSGVEALWYDAYLHADDIRAALGMASERGPGLRAGIHHVAEMLDAAGWGPATLALDGVEEVPVGDGEGRRVTGDPMQFLLTATGRADPGELGLDETVNIYR